MKIAVLGATSQIAQDLLRQWKKNNKNYDLALYSRRADVVSEFMNEIAWEQPFVSLLIADFQHTEESFDAIINFIGHGKPGSIVASATEIMKVTAHYDDIVMRYLYSHHDCKYLFLSSGSVYGSIFDQPVSNDSTACVPINNITSRNAYSIAKLYAEAKHRLNNTNTIIDIRVFNIFSRYQNLNSGFFITDIVRAIRDNTILNVSPDHMVRDFLHPDDFFRLIDVLLGLKVKTNTSVDCYSKEPVDKITLLEYCSTMYGLMWRYDKEYVVINSTGGKSNYYSKNKKAEHFGYHPLFSSLDTISTEIDALKDAFFTLCSDN